MHFFKSFTAIATVAFAASCAIAVPFGDAGSAATPSASLPNTPDNHQLDTFLASLAGSAPVSGHLFPSSTTDAPPARPTDPRFLEKLIGDILIKLNSQVRTLESIASSAGTSGAGADLTPTFSEINAALSSLSEALYIVINQVPIVFKIGSTALDLAAGIMSKISTITAQGPAHGIPALLNSLVRLVKTLSYILSILGGAA